jgi:hypothetical protein
MLVTDGIIPCIRPASQALLCRSGSPAPPASSGSAPCSQQSKAHRRLAVRISDGGVFEQQAGAGSYDSVAFRFIAANDHPGHDTIATFRRRFLKDIGALLVRVLELAREMGLLRHGGIGRH